MKTPALLILAASLIGAASVQAVTYSIDGGSNGSAIGGNVANWSAVGINHFTAAAGGQNIDSVSVIFGAGSPSVTNLSGGEAFTVGIWSDPNSDGNPADAVLLSSASGIITAFNDNVTWQTTAIPAVGLTVGQSFFAGVYYQSYAANVLPQGVSLSGGSPTDSWVAYNPSGTINLNALSAAPVLDTVQNALLTPGLVANIRANGVPEPGSAMLAGLAALGLMRRRRA